MAQGSGLWEEQKSRKLEGKSATLTADKKEIGKPGKH
jgi:hypothetical protein